MRARSSILAGAALLASCGVVPDMPSAPLQTAELVGSFNVSLNAPSESNAKGHTSVIGKIYDAPLPPRIEWEESMREGDCTLSTPRVSFCEERCGGGAVCVDGACEPYPNTISAGTVQVEGVTTTEGERSFTLTAIGNAYQPKADVKLPFPAFEEGDAIRIEASGGDVSAFVIEARGIAPLVLEGAAFPVAAETPLDLRWIAAKAPSRSSIHLKLDLSHHGGSKGMLECRTKDDGGLQVSAAMITSLLELGVAGFPSLILTRESKGSVGTTLGRVELTLDSQVERYVTIDGLSSCTSDGDCAAGETCQPDLTCA